MRHVVCVVLLAACSGQPRSLSNDRAEVASVDSALRAYDAVLTAMDTAKLRTLVAPSFRMHEDGSTMDIKTSNRIVGAMAKMGKMTRTLRNVAIEQRGPVAWARYEIRGSFVAGRDTMTFDRLESAILEKRDGRWLVAFGTTMPIMARTTKSP